MAFTGYAFLLVFLPAALAGYALAVRLHPWMAKAWLLAASLVFYATWTPEGLPILAASIWGNAWAARRLAERSGGASPLLHGAIAANLAALAWYRYLPGAGAIPPLGLSFLAFTQIGHLLDAHAGDDPRRPLIDRMLLGAFFPALIAGPVLTAREALPQFATLGRSAPQPEDIAQGLLILGIGLLKKTLLAEPLEPIVSRGHADPDALTLFSAWHVALAYSMRLYFDFSGYSDMAVGAARLFGLRYPWNFDAPYRAASIVAYWQRWHMSLTRFVGATIHAPLTLAIVRARAAAGLGIDRAAQKRPIGFIAMVAVPTAAAMMAAALWHGFTAPFLVFGVMHVVFLLANHAWRRFRPPSAARPSHRIVMSIAATYVCALAASVVFGSPTLDVAWTILTAMGGANGVVWAVPGAQGAGQIATLAVLFAIVWFAPTTARFVRDAPWSWRMSPRWAVASGAIAAVGLMAAGGPAEFLYHRF